MSERTGFWLVMSHLIVGVVLFGYGAIRTSCGLVASPSIGELLGATVQVALMLMALSVIDRFARAHPDLI